MKNMPNNELTTDDKYNFLIEDLRAIILEAVRVSREEIIKAKWELGKKVVSEENNFNRGVYGQRTIEGISLDIGMSTIGLYKCIQFYRMFPREHFEQVMSELPYGNNCSWNKIVNKVLPASAEEEAVVEVEEDCRHEVLQCTKCKRKFTLDEILEAYSE
jgi:hypothetical protein